MKKAAIFIFILLQLTHKVWCQKDMPDPPKSNEKPQKDWNWRERIYFGGNLGAWLGTTTFVDLSPLVGYKVTKKFSVGVGVIYNYYSYSSGTYKYKTSLYGGRCFARYFILENVFAQIGWDHINRDNPYSYVKERIWVDNYLVGGGIRYPISDRFYCTAVGLWNLNETPLSPYPNPIIQIGFAGSF